VREWEFLCQTRSTLKIGYPQNFKADFNQICTSIKTTSPVV